MPDGPRSSRPGWRRPGSSPQSTSPPPRPCGDPTSLDLIREGGNRVGQVIAGLVSFFNPGLVVIGGGVTGLGHTLLASVRTQVYRQSLPLATGNLPIVLGELGPVAGVIGAARLISDHLFSPA